MRWASSAGVGSRFALQRWRAWIETGDGLNLMVGCEGSPVSDGGRGLKLPVIEAGTQRAVGSPVSDGGRGLKPALAYAWAQFFAVRPSAMAGVD